MTPTPALLLFVALFWTLPASAAAFLYRKNGNSFEDLSGAFQDQIARIVEGVREGPREPQAVEA